ncbi:KR domain-containing protein [Chaetomium fimeti]|uniref:KR domain-containing protein n=1 Tax=Chaetomium fimeti TaxID=1854472 RepID=A0AAE0HEY1_9PEZI|nr:KR domain-containing protein [Chaetomium fimeti]
MFRYARQEHVAASLDGEGCRARAVACNVADEARLREALQGRSDLPPIRGVIHAGMDMAYERKKLGYFQAPLRPKVQGSLNLHNPFQDVDFFIMLSSLGGVVSTAGQANYAAGNAFQDPLPGFGREQGLQAVAIDFGMVETVGHVAANAHDIGQRLERAGLASMTETDMLRIVELAIREPSASAQITTCISTGPGPQWEKSIWYREGRFADLRYRKTVQSQAETPTKGEERLRDQIASGPAGVGAAGVVCKGVIKKIGVMFGLVEEDISPVKKPVAGRSVEWTKLAAMWKK